MSSTRINGASIAAFVSAICLSTSVTLAQEQPGETTSTATQTKSGKLEEVVVTGSSIKDTAPVGSNLVSLGADDLEKTASINLSSLVNTIPSISTAGSLAQGENVFSFYSPQIHSLAGSSSNTTLVIVDGLRIPGGGQQFNQTDPNIIPTSAIRRVDVLADGASSVYGSDAVAGVVNFITRRTFDGFEANLGYGFANNYHTSDINGIWGHTWDTGGVYVASQYSNAGKLMARDRPYTSQGNYLPVGGTNNNSYQCEPATMSVTGVSTGTAPSGIFLSPSATTTVANTPNNAPCNISLYATLVPEQYRFNALMKVVNDFSNGLSFTYMLNVNKMRTVSPNAPGGLTNVTAFGAGQGVTGQANPFFQAPAGATAATKESVTAFILRPDGNYGISETQEDVIYNTFNLSYGLAHDWSVSFDDALGWNRSAGNAIQAFCGACANLALNGTAQSGGSTTATDIAGQNVVALNLPLTTTNALDVWNPVGTNQTSGAVLRQIYSLNTENTNYNSTNQMRLTFQGPLVTLPAGQMKVAVGGEYFWHAQTQKITGSNNTGPTTTGSSFRQFNYGRHINSGFAELFIPVVSPDMGIPGLHQIDVNISGRYDEYSDVGKTTNPKYAFNWEFVKGLKLRANYATAFVAPPLAVIGDPTQGYLYASGSVGTTGSVNVPVANYPQAVSVPGAVIAGTNNPCVNVTGNEVCTIGQAGAMRRQLGGGFTHEVPQKGKSWSYGVDFAPTWLTGFTGSVTFFHNQYIGGVSSPSPTAIVNNKPINNLLTICPTGCTPQQITDFANVANGATISGSIPTTVYYLIDQSTRNALNLLLEGIDASLNYHFEVGAVNYRFGESLSYFTKFTQNFGGGTDFDILNTSGFNTTFPSVKFKNRANFGVDIGGFSGDLFWNHTGAYKNWASTAFNPVVVVNGLPQGGGDDVKADNTYDLHFQYTLGGEGTTKGWMVSADVHNATDKKPPFFNGNTSGIFGNAAGWGYNGFVTNPVGRLITVSLRTRF